MDHFYRFCAKLEREHLCPRQTKSGMSFVQEPLDHRDSINSRCTDLWTVGSGNSIGFILQDIFSGRSRRQNHDIVNR